MYLGPGAVEASGTVSAVNLGGVWVWCHFHFSILSEADHHFAVEIAGLS